MESNCKDIVIWNLGKVSSEIYRCDLQLQQICTKAKMAELDMSQAGPILNHMMMTCDALHADARHLLQTCDMKGGGKAAPTGFCASAGSGRSRMMSHQHTRIARDIAHDIAHDTQTKDQDESKISGSSSETDKCASLLGYRFPMGGEKTAQSAQTQTHSDQILDSKAYNDLSKRMSSIERTLSSEKILKRIEALEKCQMRSDIPQRLEAIEKRQLPIDLPGRVDKLQLKVQSGIFHRLETLENHLSEVKEGVFGKDDATSNERLCILSQLSGMKATFNEGKFQLQTVEENLQQLKEEVASIPVGQPDNSQTSVHALIEQLKKDADAQPNQTVPKSLKDKSKGKNFVAFQVFLDHEGEWSDGVILDKTTVINYNFGDAFNTESCQFVAPVNGLYHFGLWAQLDSVVYGGDTKVEVWRSRKGKHEHRIFYVALNQTRVQSFKAVNELRAGDKAVVRAYGGADLEFCMFEGSLSSSL